MVVLAWDYWQSRFHGDQKIIGRSVAINGHAVTVIGVAPKGFAGHTPALHMQAYLPLGMLVIDAGTPPDFLSRPDQRPFVVFARLKRGNSIAQVSDRSCMIQRS